METRLKLSLFVIDMHKAFYKTESIILSQLQDKMWNGWDDENDPKFVTQEEYDSIEALLSKIKHMIFNIGCPSSVLPMLESILSRRLKRWQANNTIETDRVIKYSFIDGKSKRVERMGFGKGKQLKSNSDIRQVINSVGYYGERGIILVGHFRWNNRGYILTNRMTDFVRQYIVSDFY